MANTITITFTPCSPPPVNGYNIKYRIAGSTDLFTDAGDFLTSPAVIVDPNPEVVDYEGIIRSDCGDGIFGSGVPWDTIVGSGSGGRAVSVRVSVSEGTICGNSPNIFYISDIYTDIAPGVIVYVDAGLTTPLAGASFISNAAGVIFNIDSGTGVVGGPTGNSC